MSQRVVGYEGEGRHRRAIYEDLGPAAAGGVSGLAALGRLSALAIRETAGVIESAGSEAAVERVAIREAEGRAQRSQDWGHQSIKRQEPTEELVGDSPEEEIVSSQFDEPVSGPADVPPEVLSVAQRLQDVALAASAAENAWGAYQAAQQGWSEADAGLRRAIARAGLLAPLPTVSDYAAGLAPVTRVVPCACGGRLSAPAGDERAIAIAVERHNEPPRHRAWRADHEL